MGKTVTELYGDCDTARLSRRIKRWRAVLLVIAVAAFAACVAMVALTGTENSSRMETAVITVSTIAGWIVIYGSVFVVISAKRELRHADMLRSENRSISAGEVTVTDERVKIKRSITARRVEVSADGKTLKALVCETRADALANAGASAVHTVHGFVAAYEVAS